MKTLALAVLYHLSNPAAAAPELLGNPIRQFYQHSEAKNLITDLQLYQNRIYIAHGSSDTDIDTLAIHFDLKSGKFDLDRRPDGEPVKMNAEIITRLRVFDDTLYFANYDPIRWQEGVIEYRKKDEKWESMRVSEVGHNRDFFRFDGRLFVLDGTSHLTVPSINWSPEDGSDWRRVEQPELFPGKPETGLEFFTFKGILYTTYFSPPAKNGEPRHPYMLRYTGDAKKPFRVAFASAAALLPGIDVAQIAQPIQRAVEFKERLVFIAGGLFSAASLDEAKPEVSRITLREGFAAFDTAVDGGAVYVLAARFERDAAKGYELTGFTHQILRTTDGVNFIKVAEFSRTAAEGRVSALEVAGEILYLGCDKGDFLRLRLPPP